MKLWSKEALLLGGVYAVLAIPFTCIDYIFDSDSDIFTLFLFFLFVCCAVRLVLNSKPLFLSRIINDYPKTAYYLSSFGWIPYFIFIYPAAVFCLSCVVDISENTADTLRAVFDCALILGFPASLLFAFAIKLKGK